MKTETGQKNNYTMHMVLDREDGKVKSPKQDGFVFWGIITFLLLLGGISSYFGIMEDMAYRERMERNDSQFCVALSGLSKHVGYDLKMKCTDIKHAP